MTMANMGGPSALYSSSIKTKQVTQNKPEGGKKTADDVLNHLRELMPGWTITTSSADWGEGFRNIEIDREILQQMADDPRAMKKYTDLLLGLEDMVPDLEKLQQDNLWKSVELGISLDANGNASVLAVIKTLMDTEIRTSFELPGDKSSWADFIRERLEALSQGQVDDVTGSRSWIV